MITLAVSGRVRRSPTPSYADDSLERPGRHAARDHGFVWGYTTMLLLYATRTWTSSA